MDNFLELLKNIGEEELNLPASKVEEELKSIQVEGEAGAGLVRVKMNGIYKIQSFYIDDDLLQIDKKQILEDLLTAAINHAIDKAKKATKDIAYGKFMDNLHNVLDKMPSQNK